MTYQYLLSRAFIFHVNGSAVGHICAILIQLDKATTIDIVILIMNELQPQ